MSAVQTDPRLGHVDKGRNGYGGSLEKALQRLVEQLNDEFLRLEARPESVDGQEILLDVVMDGLRYTLARTIEPKDEVHVNLSPREREIVRLVAKGLPNKTIAAVLGISVWTVSTHLRRIFNKMGVHSRAEMVARTLATA